MLSSYSETLLKSMVDGACPVCNRTHDKDCRWKPNQELVLCMTKAKGGSSTVPEPADEVNGYKFTKLTSDGKWAEYVQVRAKWNKPAREAGKNSFDYHDRVTGQIICRVTRSDDGNGEKNFSQLYRNPDNGQWEKYTRGANGKWQSSFSDALKVSLKARVQPYRWHECQQAITDGKPIFVCEGEGKADALIAVGLAAISFIGGSGKFRHYGYEGYKTDLANARLVLCPDRDRTGVDHMEDIAADFPTAQWLYAEPDSPEWKRIPQSGGFDVADWLRDGATREALLAHIREKRHSAKGKSTNVVPIRPGVQLSGEALLQKLDDIIDQGVSGSTLTSLLSELAHQSGRQPRDVRELYQQREQEREAEETRAERKTDIERLQRIAEARIDLTEFLDSSLPDILKRKYALLGVPEAAALATLFPVVGSLCPIGTRLLLSKATDFMARPIVYSCIVAESGSNKSAAMQIITDPLTKKLQSEAHAKYQEELESYEAAIEEWQNTERKNRGAKPKPPVARDYFVTDFTPEAIALIQSQQPDRGLLNYQDELSAIINGRGKYTKGKGTEKENLLSGKDGAGIKVNRASGKSLYVAETSMSIVGSTQPDTLKEMMGDFSDGAGEWARFLFMHIPLQAQPKPTDDVSLDVFDWLVDIYQRIAAFPAETYYLSPEAASLYWEWHGVLEAKRMEEPRQALRSVFSKMKGDTGNLALLFHVLNTALRNEKKPGMHVSETDMRRAIAYIKFAINNVIQIHMMGAKGEDKQTALRQKVIALSERKGLLTASDVKRYVRCEESREAIRDLFLDLVAMGFGQTQGIGKSLKWSMDVVAPKAVKHEPEPETMIDSTPEPIPPPESKAKAEQLSKFEHDPSSCTRADGESFKVGEKVNLGASLEWDDFDWVNIDGLTILEFIDGRAKLEFLELPHPLEMLQKRVQVGA